MNELAVEQGMVEKEEDSKERVWMVGELKPFSLSKRETVIVDAYLKFGSYASALRVYNERFPTDKISPHTVERWLKKRVVQDHVYERVKKEAIFNKYSGEEGKKAWLVDMIEYRDGRKKADRYTIYIMDLIGKYLGYGKEGMVVNRAEKQVVNFYQLDGSR